MKILDLTTWMTGFLKSHLNEVLAELQAKNKTMITIFIEQSLLGYIFVFRKNLTWWYAIARM